MPCHKGSQSARSLTATVTATGSLKLALRLLALVALSICVNIDINGNGNGNGAVSAFTVTQASNLKPRRLRKWVPVTVVASRRDMDTSLHSLDHLVSCGTGSLAAEVFGRQGLECIQGSSPFAEFGGILGQIINVAFPIVAYFILKRGANGFRDWRVADNVDNMNNNRVQSDADSRQVAQSRLTWSPGGGRTAQLCPVCDGSGSDMNTQCNLCGGLGIVPGNGSPELPASTGTRPSRNRALRSRKETSADYSDDSIDSDNF